MGLPFANCAPALEILRTLAATFYVTAQQVDVLAELFDSSRDKVPLRPCPDKLCMKWPWCAHAWWRAKCVYVVSAVIAGRATRLRTVARKGSS